MVQSMLLEINSTTFEDDIEYKISQCVRTNNNISIIIDIVYTLEYEVIQSWEITCIEVEEHEIKLSNNQRMFFTEDHVLLWEYQHQNFDLYLTSKAINTNEILGHLYKRHEELTESWVPFGSYFNKHNQNILDIGQGLLATGPSPIILAYENILNCNSIKTSKIPCNNMKQWNDGKFEILDNIKALIFDESYLIAKNFIAKKLK
ncbi:hypothetical protein [Cohnella mopanensis]|uniref:hypothetical protein n=1 Tax=Cohnella mopanensis TaxID=2911966 RepID=UPI001EF97C64|nr:hypothetical protein [Cohnella mopanensis]